MTIKAYQKIAKLICAIENCKRSNNDEWLKKHKDNLNDVLVQVYLCCNFLYDESNEEKLVFVFKEQHFNDVGYYEETTEHKITVIGSLAYGIVIKSISGKNKNKVKDHLIDHLLSALHTEVEE